MIAERIYRGESASSIGITENNYASRKKTLDRFLNTDPPLDDFRAEYLSWLKTDESGSMVLLGDCIEKVLKTTGIHQAVKGVEKITGTDCGCGKRKEDLNNWDRNRRLIKHEKN